MTDKTPKEIMAYDMARLATISNIGMKGVDPMDIQPPKILLMSNMSDFSTFTDAEGKSPKVGDYFHTGKNLIMKDFVCHFLFAAKRKWIDKRKGGEEKDMYATIGCFGEDLTLFGMSFRSSSLYALAPLFTAAKSQRRPMFSLICKVETKELTNDKGTWNIPVVRVVGPEADTEKLAKLEELAKRLDSKTEEVVVEKEDDGIPF